MEVPGDTAHEVFENYFQEFWQVRRFILDDEGRIRPRLTVCVDGRPLLDRIGLSDPVHLNAEILVQQMPIDTEYEEPH
jgi:hypothetical protein